MMAEGDLLSDALGERDENGELASITVTADKRDPLDLSPWRWVERPRLQRTLDDYGDVKRRYAAKIAVPASVVPGDMLPLPEFVKFKLPDGKVWALDPDGGVEEGPEVIISLAADAQVRQTASSREA